MLRAEDEILARIVALKQKEHELLDQFAQLASLGESTDEVEAMLVALGEEIAMLGVMVKNP